MWTGILIAVAVFAALALMVGPGDIRTPSLPAELARQPDAYLEDGTISQFRADGALHYRMHVERATYFDQGRTAEVTAPVVEFFTPSAAPWRIEAASGEVRNVTAPGGATEERADLAGDVVLSQHAAEGTRLALHTQALTLYPAREIVRGDQPVMIERGVGSRTVAAGFEADLATSRIQLFSDADRRVHIVLQPTEFQ
ncbi:MAG: LPS export ABC transporter periplasmic protein LptC [Gammaproteobacteria bacterium]|nr:LPS export ABC transporter periplasmic protein LptC [Gammaproteobacteria bacterium]